MAAAVGQLARVLALGDAAAQRYWFAEPVPPETFTEMLAGGLPDKGLCQIVRSHPGGELRNQERGFAG